MIVIDAESPGQDVLIEATRLVVGLVFELAPQRLAQEVELGERALASARHRVDPHQLAVGELVQRLADERLLECGERGTFVADPLALARKAQQQGQIVLLQRLTWRDRPLLKAILRQQLTAVELDRRAIFLDAGVIGDACGGRLEFLHVDLQALD